MTYKQANNSIFENFNLDGTISDNPVEKLKENQVIQAIKKKVTIQFFLLGLLSHIFHFLILQEPEVAASPKQESKAKLVIPQGYGQISVPAELMINVNQDIIRIKVLNKSYSRQIASGYIKKNENEVLSAKHSFEEAKKINFYVPYEKFESILKHAQNGLIIAPYETKLKKGKSYEIVL